MYYINYDNQGYNHNKSLNGLSIIATTNNKTITHIDIIFNRITAVIDKSMLSSFNYSIINQDDSSYNKDMWYKINQHSNTLTKEDFIYGFVTYLSFFSLISNQHFIKLLPFTFDIPCSLEKGDCCDYNIMHYMVIPLNSIMNIIEQDCLLYHYIKNILQFIEEWSRMFHVGPLLDYDLLNKLNYDIAHGLSQYSIKKLNEYKINLKQMITDEIKSSLKELVSEELELRSSQKEEDSFDEPLPKKPTLKFDHDISFSDYDTERQPPLILKKHIY